MRFEYLKTLWMLRFKKIKKTEDEAAWRYQEILDECLGHFGNEDETVTLLRRLVREERFHSRLAGELIRICRRNHPEVNALNGEDSLPA